MKKLMSLLLAFVMLFSLAMPAMAAEEDTATVYFQNNWLWTDVYAYVHYTDGAENAAYPGVALEVDHKDDYYDIYSVEFAVSNIDYIIFSGVKNDGTDVRDATPKIPASDLYRTATYYCVWDNGNTYNKTGGEGEPLDSVSTPSAPSINGNTTGNVTATYTPSTTEPDPDPATKTIYFDNTKGWGNVNAYTWGSEVSNPNWPGIAMTLVEGETSIYSVEVPADAVNIIFNNGSGAQTADQTIPTDDKNLFTPGSGSTGGTWSVYGSTTEPEPTVEAKWGTSKDDLSYSGTLAAAIAAAAADSGITYIQLQKNVTADYSYGIYSGVFTLDLNGKTLTGDSNYVIGVNSSAAQVTLTDTAGGGEVVNETSDYAIFVMSGKVVIDGGSYSGSYSAVCVFGGIVQITDGTFSAGTYGHIAYGEGTLDLSEYYAVIGLTIYSGVDVTVSDETIKLPGGCVFQDGAGNTVDTLVSGTVYTIRAEGGSEPSYSVTIDSAIDDGTVTVDENTVKQGERVTVVFTPSEGYVLFRSFAYDSGNSGNYVTLTPGTDENTFTFIMPAHDVTVSGLFVKDGRARDDLYFNNGGNTAWTNVNADFCTSLGNWLETVSLTMAETGIYTLPEGKEIPNLAYYVAFSCGTENTVYELIPTGEENMFTLGSTTDTSGDYEGTWSKYTPSQPPEDTTSADITWGSMAFTYTDGKDGAEGAWSNDVTGGGTVTVKNTGDTAFTANISYTAVAEYAEITGTFDADSADLAAEASKIFTLTLNGKPNKAITAGTKIGSVTIVIVNDSGASGEDESDVTIVTDEQGLEDALKQGGKIKLGDDIALESQLMVKSNVSIDLNEKTLSCSNDIVMSVYEGTTVSISNGKIVGSGTALINWGTLSIDNCTVTSTMKSLDNSAGTTVVTNSTLNGFADGYGGTITLHDNVTLGAGTNYDGYIGLSCSKDNSSIVCYFDPSVYLLETFYKQNVTDNGDGTWTVTKAAE